MPSTVVGLRSSEKGRNAVATAIDDGASGLIRPTAHTRSIVRKDHLPRSPTSVRSGLFNGEVPDKEPSTKRIRQLAIATVCASAALIAVAQPASAAELELDPGIGCAFPLGLDGGAFPPERHTFTGRDGKPITIFAGKSGALTWTNLDTKKTLTFKSRGTALRVTTISKTSQILEFSGHAALVLFPTDVPAGPTTTQMTGRLVLSYNPVNGDTEVLKQEGQQTDVCAALL